MKKLLTALVSLLPVLGMAQTITKISQFPNTNALGPNQLFVVTAGATNMNVKTSDMPGALGVPTLAQMYGIGLNVTNYVISHTNFDVASFNTAVVSNRIQFATPAGYADFAGIRFDYGSGGIRIGDLQGAMGTYNLVIGMSAATNFAAGYIGNTVIGEYAFSQSGAGSTYNTIIGQSAASQASGSSNIIIGAFSGDQLNGSGHLVFDSTSRSGTQPTTSIIFGQIAATPAEQYIRFNVATNETLGGYIVAANASITNNAVVSGWLSQVGGTNYGDSAKTNWTTPSTATGNDLLVTNTAGGSMRVVNGRLIIPANGTTTGGASNLVGGLALGHTNDQRAYLTIGLTNGSGITNEWAILVTSNGNSAASSSATYPLFGLKTNGIAYIRDSLNLTTISAVTVNGDTMRNGAGAVISGAAFKFISDSRGSSVTLGSGNSTFNPSNNLFVAGQCIASNGIVAKIHSTYGPSTNIVPLVVQPNSGGAQNFVEVYGTNGTTLVQTVNSNGVTHVNPGGGLNPVGCFGALMNNTSNTVVCAGGAGVYTNICGTGFTTITTNGFIGGTQAISAGLTNLTAGYYRVFINASYLGGNSTTYEFDVVTNGTACTLLEVKNTTDNPARFRTSSAGGIIYLPSNCGVQMMVQDGGGGSTINVFRSSITIGTP